jgi:ATP-dependent RNA helicase DeaD
MKESELDPAAIKGEQGGDVPPIQLPPGARVVEDLPQATMADLPERLQQAAALAGWTELMPVQAKAMPYLFAQRDMMIQSRTGSGKTGAYLMPILELINPLERLTQALVLVPTRELALQVAHEAEVLGRATGARSLAVYGGVGYREQLDGLQAGAHLVIGTPGRILDHLERRSLSLDRLQFLVFDEADRMLSMGFYPDMRRVQSYLPDAAFSPLGSRGNRRHVSSYMFSATFPLPVIRLADQFLEKPGFLNLSSDHIHVTETEHVFYTVPGMDKDRSLVRIIEVENPASALIFCNTRVRVDYVNVVLQRFGYDADALTSDLSQVAREIVMGRVRKGTLRFLVATDVAARGIDLPELSHVIQYEPPEDPEAYIHRAGRTGRAGGSGTAISLVNPGERPALLRISKQFGINIEERPLPDDEDVQRIVSERIIALLEARLRGRDKLLVERMSRFQPLVRGLVQVDEEAGLLAMLMDDFYQDTFHAPLAPLELGDEPPAQRPRAAAARKTASRQRGSHGRPRRKR